MNLNLKIINPFSDPAWDRFVMSHPEGSFFHTSSWARVLHESYGFRPVYLAGKEGNDITSGLPLIEVQNVFGRKKAVSRPFSDFCEPLCHDKSTFDALFFAGIDMAKKADWRSLELRGGELFLPNEAVWSSCFTHDLDLEKSEKDLLSGLRDSTRRNIRKAEKEGVTVSHETTPEAVRDFYRLHCLTRREHGLPPQPKSFFDHLQALVIAPKYGFVSIAHVKGNAIAADLFVVTGQKAVYKYGASDRQYQNLRPSNLLMWEGLLKCKALGAKTLNLGRTELQHSGLLQFKRGFGCSEKKVNYYQYDTRTALYKNGILKKEDGIAHKILRHMPVAVLKLLGKCAYRYAG